MAGGAAEREMADASGEDAVTGGGDGGCADAYPPYL